MIISACLALVASVAPVFESSFGPAPVLAAARAQTRSSGARDVDWKTAPDGDRGFGAGRSLHDITRLLRSTAEEDRAIIASLFKLESDLRILLALVTDRYKSQGYFALLGATDEGDLDALGAAFRAKQRAALRELDQTGPGAELLARMLVDARFRSRLRVVEGFEFEA